MIARADRLFAVITALLAVLLTGFMFAPALGAALWRISQ